MTEIASSFILKNNNFFADLLTLHKLYCFDQIKFETYKYLRPICDSV